MQRRSFLASLAAGPAVAVLGPQCGPTNPPGPKTVRISRDLVRGETTTTTTWRDGTMSIEGPRP